MRRGKGRGRVWRGIRDWFRPAEAPESSSSSRSLPAAVRTAAPSSSLRDASFSIPCNAPDYRPNQTPNQTPDRSTPNPASTSWGRARVDSIEDGGGDFGGIADQAGEAVLEFSGGDGADERELLEFLAADLDPVPADPAFRERLREELWDVVLDDVARRSKA